MPKLLVAVTLALALTGCGVDSGSSNNAGSSNHTGSLPNLDGTWILDMSNGCALGVTIQGSDYEQDLSCQLTNGNLGVETELGTFTQDATVITATPTSSTCPAHSTRTTLHYSVHGSLLSLVYPQGTEILEHRAPVRGPALIQNGCWDAGTFTQHALQNL
jgi:hypothetical protein